MDSLRFLALVVAALVPQIPAAQQAPQINNLSGPPDLQYFGEVGGPFLVTPDGTQAVFFADGEIQGKNELYSAPLLGGGEMARLTPDFLAHESLTGLEVTTGGDRVIYAKTTFSTDFELYSVPIDGSELPVLLNPLHQSAAQLTFHVLPDGSRVIFQQDVNFGGTLLSVPIDGSSAPTELATAFRNYRLTPDGHQVVYFDSSGSGLHRIASDGSGSPVPLSPHSSTGLSLSPDGARAVHGDSTLGLYSVPVDGSEPAVELFPQSGSILSFEVSPDSMRVLLHHEVSVSGVETQRLYAIPIDGGTPTLLVESTTETFEPVGITEDSQRAVYIVELDRLFSLPLAGGVPSFLHANVQVYPITQAQLALDRVVFMGKLTNGPVSALSVPVDGSEAAVQLNGPGPVIQRITLSPAFDRVVIEGCIYKGGFLGPCQLRSAPVDGSSPSVSISGPQEGSGEISHLYSDDGSQIVYLFSESFSGRDIYRRASDGSGASQKINGPLAGVFAADVDDYVLSADGRTVAFVGSFVSGSPMNQSQFFWTRADGNTPRVDLGVESTSSYRWLGLTEGYVLWGGSDLRSTSMEGGSMAILNQGLGGLFGANVSGFALNGAEDEVIMAVNGIGVSGYYRVPIDGSAMAIRISSSNTTSSMIDPLFTMDEQRDWLFYEGTVSEINSARDLYYVPVDGSETEYILSNAPGEITTIVRIVVTPDGSRAVYEGKALGTSDYALYSVAREPGAIPVPIGTSQVLGSQTVDLALTDDAQSAVFIARLDAGTGFELFSASVAGGTPSRLNTDLPPGGHVLSFDLLPSDVVYLANQQQFDRDELYVVPVDGSGAPIKLSGHLAPDGNVTTFTTTPDGLHALFAAETAAAGQAELFIVPVDASHAPELLTSALTNLDFIFEVQITPGGLGAVFVARQDIGNIFEVQDIFRVSLTGSPAPRRLTRPLGEGQFAGDFTIAPNGGRVFYRSNQEVDEAIELFTARLPAIDLEDHPADGGTRLR